VELKYLIRRLVQILLHLNLSLIVLIARIFRCLIPLRINFLRNYYDNFYENYDATINIREISPRAMVAVDVGSRGGEHHLMSQYRHYFKNILVEPELDEANQLKRQGNLVIDKAISDSSGKKTLYLTRNLAGSSLFKPDEKAFRLYNPSSDYFYDHFTLDKSISVECTTVENALGDLNIDYIDFLKIDTQGAEANVILGLGFYRPLAIYTEVQFIPLYKGITNGTELVSYLYDLGYICIHQTSSINGSIMMVEADCLFVPNHLSEAGKKIIKGREKEYSSIMLMFGQVRILKIVSEQLNFVDNYLIQKIRDPFV
jgi:FkbM family methyltransferase